MYNIFVHFVVCNIELQHAFAACILKVQDFIEFFTPSISDVSRRKGNRGLKQVVLQVDVWINLQREFLIAGSRNGICTDITHTLNVKYSSVRSVNESVGVVACK